MFSRVDSALYTLWQDQLSLSSMGFTDTPRGGGGEISIDRDERRFFLGKKILVSNFFFSISRVISFNAF